MATKKITRSVDDVVRDVGLALRDPALSQWESNALASLVVTERCSYADARTALGCFRRLSPDYEVGTAFEAVALLQPMLRQARPERLAVRINRNVYRYCGATSNVMHAQFVPSLRHGGVVEVSEWGIAQVRLELRRLHSKSLNDAVRGRPVANDNEPAVTNTGEYHWQRNVQPAWVRRAKARRASHVSAGLERRS
jgi:hypothetical protein